MKPHTRLLALCVALVLLSSFLTTFVVVGSAAPGNTATGTQTATDAPWMGAPAPTNSTATTTAAPTPTPTDTPSTTSTETATATPSPDAGGSDDEQRWTLEELKSDGPHQANSPPGVRMGDQRAYWAVYWPANNPWANVGSTEGGQYLPADHTVGRNAVWLRTWTYESEQKTVHVVYWEKGQQTVQRGNSTTTEAVAENVTHVTHEVTFDRGRPTVKIPLQQHDTPVQATMWIEGEEYARWTFGHHSIATTQSVSIDSAGDYLSSVILDFLVWIVVGGFVVGILCKKALDRAGIGPQYGYAPWIAGLTILTGLAAVFLFQSLADLVVNAKFLLAGYVVAIFGIILLETYTTNVSKALFLRPTLEYTESPTGEDAYDIIDVEARSKRIVRGTDGSVSVVTPGLFPFLARVFGKSARLENIEQLRTRVPMKNSDWDEMFVTDPEADTLLHYIRPGFEFSLPPLEKENAPQYLVGSAAVLLAVLSFRQGAASGPALAAAVGVGLFLWVVEPTDGTALVEPAPIHIRQAIGTMFRLQEDVDNAKRFDEVKRQRDEERISKQRDVDREVANHDSTLVEEMLDPDSNVPAGDVDMGEDEPDEVFAFDDDELKEWAHEQASGGGADD